MSTTKELQTEDEVPIRLEALRKALETSTVPTLENVSAALVSPRNVSGEPLRPQVVRLSALGAELLLEKSEHVPGLGENAVVSITTGNSKSTFAGPVVALETIGQEQLLLAVRFAERRVSQQTGVERRQGTRWNCPEEFCPTGVASNPSKYNDFVYFRVQDISESGFRLLTSMRNRFLAPQMSLDCIVSFPMVSQIAITVRVMNLGIASEDEKDFLSVGVATENLSRHQREVIAQYLAQFADYQSVSELRANDLAMFSVSRTFEYSFANTATDYASVLELRYLAYRAEGKLNADQTIDDMSDVFDARSRILMCRKGDRVVGTARLTFHEHSDSLEHEQYLSWPPDLPRRDEVVEITRLCAHPEFQGAGLFFSLLRFCVITAVQARRNWVVSSAVSDLVPMYEAVGLKSVHLDFNHPEYNGLQHHLLVGNIQDAMLGRTSNAMMWNLVWRDAFAFMADHQFVNVDAVSRVRLSLYRVLSPVIPILRRFMSYRSRSKARS